MRTERGSRMLSASDRCRRRASLAFLLGETGGWDGGTVERWNGGTVKRWNGGTVERWNGETVERWNGGTVERNLAVRKTATIDTATSSRTTLAVANRPSL